MIRILNYLTLIFLVALSTECMSRQELRFVKIEKVLEEIKSNKLNIQQLSFDIENIFYLDTGLISEVNRLVTLDKNKIRHSNFIIDENDKEDIQLSLKVSSLEDLLIRPDIELSEYLKSSFGIDNYKDKIESEILIYKNRYFVQFTNDGSLYALIFELINDQTVRVEIAYIIID